MFGAPIFALLVVTQVCFHLGVKLASELEAESRLLAGRPTLAVRWRHVDVQRQVAPNSNRSQRTKANKSTDINKHLLNER